MTTTEQAHVLRQLADLDAAPDDVRERAAAILEYFGRNKDLGWSEGEAMARACEKVQRINYGEAL